MNAAGYVGGSWAYLNLAGGASGIVLLPKGCNTGSSAICWDANWLVTLSGVPKDFFDIVSDQQSLSGEGDLCLTREKIH
jgi:hypothetical protein